MKKLFLLLPLMTIGCASKPIAPQIIYQKIQAQTMICEPIPKIDYSTLEGYTGSKLVGDPPYDGKHLKCTAEE